MPDGAFQSNVEVTASLALESTSSEGQRGSLSITNDEVGTLRLKGDGRLPSVSIGECRRGLSVLRQFTKATGQDVALEYGGRQLVAITSTSDRRTEVSVNWFAVAKTWLAIKFHGSKRIGDN